MKYSPVFITEQLMKNNQGLDTQNKKIIQDWQYNNQNVFLRRDLIELKSKSAWRKLGRQVKPQQSPFKHVRYLYL